MLKRQRRNYKDRRIVFVALTDTTSPRDLIDAAERADADAVYLVGPNLSTGTLRNWLAAPLSPFWSHGTHYVHPPHPVLRFVGPLGETVEIHRAAAFFGEGTYTPAMAEQAFRTLNALIAGAFDEGRVLATPATTGRYLIGRSIPFGREWPVLSADAQSLIRATGGQGRIGMVNSGRVSADTLTQWDGRFMYAALCDGLPCGEPVADTIDTYAGYWRPGRYLVDFTVPKDWNTACVCGMPGHAGIGCLPARTIGGEWFYPAHPCAAITGAWVDSVELFNALEHGWRVRIRERRLYPMPPYPAVERRGGQVTKRGPLDAWAARLVKLREQVAHPGGFASVPRPPTDPLNAPPPNYRTSDVVVDLLIEALRAIVLDGIGALHGTPRRVTHVTSRDQALRGDIPAHAREVLPLGPDQFVWTDTAPHPWPEMSHPEWTSTIWARCRARLLSAPTGSATARVGMLHVPARDVVATFTDSIWLASNPAWADDGKVGRFRQVWGHHADTPFTIPTTPVGLRRFKAEA